MSLTPRDYQINDINAMSAAVKAGSRRILYCLPTGGGKTVVSAEIIRRAALKGSKIYFVAHRKELIDQTSAKLYEMEVDHGVIMASHPNYRPWLPVQVVSIQTAIRRPITWKPDIVFIDECHRARGASYQQIIEACGNPVLIGITATPIRTDNKGLGGKLFTTLIQGPGIGDLIKRGYLVRPELYSWPVNLAGVKITGGDYNQGQLDVKMSEAKLLGDVLQQWKKHCSDRTTVVFASGIGHSKLLVKQFREAGIRAEHLDGTTPKEERESILSRLANGHTQVVSNFGVLCEGWDCPRVSALSIVRPTQSLGLYLQMAGRALRPYPGKTDCIILDHGGCAHRPGFGRPDEPREWELSEDRVKGINDPQTRDVDDRIDVCPDCGRVYEKNEVDTCECGYNFAKRRQHEAKVSEGELAKYEAKQAAMQKNQKQIYFNLLLKQETSFTAAGNPYSKKYAAANFHATFKCWPPRAWEREFFESRNKESQ